MTTRKIEVDEDTLRKLMYGSVTMTHMDDYYCSHCEATVSFMAIDHDDFHEEFPHKDDCLIPGLWEKLK